MLHDDWWGGREGRQGGAVYTQLIPFVVQQKLTQHYKATIPQLAKRKDKKQVSFNKIRQAAVALSSTPNLPITLPKNSVLD